MTPTGAESLAVNSLVSLRIGEDGLEHPSRVEDLVADTVVVAAPLGVNSELFARSERVVGLSWVSPRGRYAQQCHVVEHIWSRPRLWRLRPFGEAELMQRRRYVRARAAVDVFLVLPEVVVPGVGIDISEGGVRLCTTWCSFDDVIETTVQMAIGGEVIAVPGRIVRTSVRDHGQAEVVVAFDAGRREADVIRRFVFELQLRARAAMLG